MTFTRLMLHANPQLDYLHHRILQLLGKRQAIGLQIDELVMDMVEKVMQLISGNPGEIAPVSDSLKRFHLATIENAKEYILEHFSTDISLHQLAQHCHVSPFHFSRIFKSIMNVSPHQYLADIRLNHARVLLGTTGQPVTDIAFACGYNSIEHFATAYRRKFNTNPTRYRREVIQPVLKSEEDKYLRQFVHEMRKYLHLNPAAQFNYFAIFHIFSVNYKRDDGSHFMPSLVAGSARDSYAGIGAFHHTLLLKYGNDLK